ncbi:DUF934 domain-containing protein [Acidocella sp.]|uniref:DUF934 domain-containing protein n=1 Tax=Acidocella sp. TaxID=50710 RepID=UPI003CFE76C5
MPLIDAKGVEIAEPVAADLILQPDAGLADILPRLGELAVIAVMFPKFRDGRGFTLARALRQHGYRGDLRATGHFLPDQFRFLAACGFTSFETPPEHQPGQFTAMLTHTHQPGQLLRRAVTRALESG